MKKLLLASLMTVTAMQATDLPQAWKQFSSYRVVSGGKSIITGIAIVNAADHGYRGLKNLGNVLSDGRDWVSLEKGNRIIKSTVLVGGMSYVVYKLGWDYLPVYVRHALAIK